MDHIVLAAAEGETHSPVLPVCCPQDRLEPVLLEHLRTLGGEVRFGVEPIDLVPRVFYRITDNWLELTVRFIVHTHGIRGAKDAMSRYIIGELDKAGIGIASSTYDIVGFPAVRVRAHHQISSC